MNATIQDVKNILNLGPTDNLIRKIVPIYMNAFTAVQEHYNTIIATKNNLIEKLDKQMQPNITNNKTMENNGYTFSRTM